jgi:RNA polymerase sigma-70 factor (ECF subfamily)
MALPQPDRDILRRAQAGDDRAFAIILRQYHAPIYNYAVRVLSGDRALAEDVCQEIFVRVHRALPRFDDRSLFTTWLFQIAKNRLVDEMRSRERRIRPAVEIDSVWSLGLAAPAPFHAIEDMDILWRAIGALSPDLKMALVLRDVIGLSYALPRPDPRGFVPPACVFVLPLGGSPHVVFEQHASEAVPVACAAQTRRGASAAKL